MKRICFILLAVIALCSCAKSADKERISKDVEALREDRIATLQMQKQSIAEGLEILERIDADAAGKLSDFLADNFVKGADWKDATLATLEAHDSTLSALYDLNLSPASEYLLETYLDNADSWVNYRFSAVSQLLAARGRLDKMEIPSLYPAVLSKKAAVCAGLNDAIAAVSGNYAAIVSDAIDSERGVLTEELLKSIVSARELAAAAIWDSDTFIAQYSGLPSSGVVVTNPASDISSYSARLNGILNLPQGEWTTVNFGFKYGTSNDPSAMQLKYVATKDETGWFTLDLKSLSASTQYWYMAVAVLDGVNFEGEIRSFSTGKMDLQDEGAVDLGLSVKWAACNLGASAPEETGSFFAWGETTTKSIYTWATYQWGSGEHNLAKYVTQGEYGTVDNLTVLQVGDDAASCILHGKWRTPTYEEFKELADSCDHFYVEINGERGCLFVSKANGNQIFLPTAGERIDQVLGNLDDGRYWTSTVSEQQPSCAMTFVWHNASDKLVFFIDPRFYGLNIRPVME